MDLETAAHKASVSTEKLAQAERGEHQLTLRQADLAARAYGRSLAFLFRSRPPEEPSVERKFRRLRGAPPPPWSAELVRLEREIRERQDATVDLYEATGDEPPWPEAASRLGLPGSMPTAHVVRDVLAVSPEQRRSSGYNGSRRVVLRAVEWAGVLVVRQRLPDPGVRGFLLPHPTVPAIYVSSEEDSRAQAFTILHEFAHLLRDNTGHRAGDSEEWCEAFAGEVLMPADDFRVAFARTRGSATEKAIDLASTFAVTPLAAAEKARRLGLFGWSEFVEVRDRPVAPRPDPTGGDGNRNKVARLSPTFTDLVLAAADSSVVTLSTASRLLRTKVDDFAKLRHFVAEAMAE